MMPAPNRRECRGRWTRGSVAWAAVAALATPSLAQTLPLGSDGRAAPVDALAGGSGRAAAGSGIQVATSVSMSVTGISNGGILTEGTSAVGNQEEVVVQVSPAVSILARTARLNGSLQYTANAFQYARLEEANRVSHAIRGSGRMELVDQTAFIDASISRAEQGRSAFGVPVQGLTLATPNRVEVTNASVSPYITGSILQTVDFTARYTLSVSDAATPAFVPLGAVATQGLGRLTTGTTNLSLAGGSRLRWSLNVLDSDRGYSLGRDLQTRSVLAQLDYAVDADVRLSAGLGQDESNVLGATLQRYDVWTVGALWSPTPRTELSAELSDRFFGRAHRVSLQHTLARAIFRASDARQIANQLGGGFVRPGDPVSLLDELLRSNALRTAGDAATREQLILDGLRQAGIDPNQTVVPGSINATPSAVRRQELFVGYSGLRLSLAATVFNTQTERLGSPLNPFEDLAIAPSFRQQGLTLSGGWRLTPQSSLTLNYNQFKVPAQGVLAVGSQQTLGLSWQAAVGRRASLTANVQQVSIDRRQGALTARRSSQFAALALNVSF